MGDHGYHRRLRPSLNFWVPASLPSTEPGHTALTRPLVFKSKDTWLFSNQSTKVDGGTEPRIPPTMQRTKLPSPTLPPPVACPAASPQAMAAVSLNTQSGGCPISGWGQTRIAPECGRRFVGACASRHRTPDCRIFQDRDVLRCSPTQMSTNTPTVPMGSSRPLTKEITDPNYPLLQEHATSINSVKRETFQYGPAEIHQLDIYYPPLNVGQSANEAPGSPCILVFFYGGGLARGARSSPPSHLVYNNLGAFFASRGILTVIPDYRLVPSIAFPQGSEDIRDALDWVAKNLPSTEEAERSRSRLFVLAHSAGGMHVCGFLFTPHMFSGSLVRRSLRGVALMGVPYEIHRAKPALRDAATQYYGNAKSAHTNQPSSLLQRADAADIARLPPVRNILAESEPRSVSSSTPTFVQIFRDKGGSITEHRLVGHDHLSPVLALSSGTGEEWGEELVVWMNSFPSNV